MIENVLSAIKLIILLFPITGVNILVILNQKAIPKNPTIYGINVKDVNLLHTCSYKGAPPFTTIIIS